MEKVLINPLFGLVLTALVYTLTSMLQRKTQSDLLNPLLMASITIIAILIIFNIPYETFNAGGKFITALIGPATVALAIPLYQNIAILKKHWKVVLLSILAGVIAHALIIGILAFVLSLDSTMIATLIPKSVTTAIAADVAESLGGITTLTVSIVIITGIFGAAFAPIVNKLCKIKDPIAQGLALGTAAHAVGTSKAVEMGETQGIMSTLALVVTGIATVLLSPITQIIIEKILF
ncbi:LrgB family protein [Erysipelothrix sp. HDW6C]|uniref:LrgB family protein n=1 Tax=Erysipelothrix sp. HDW6C TaxID=2714930 RepID=UPI00140A1AA8|nr:LrgB family protein [Erysipelothrix sp. HDW6C]QIK70737.1 LrgB family protein [Erysipelothrix sp. HDW6C]